MQIEIGRSGCRLFISKVGRIRIEYNFFATQIFPNFRLGDKVTALNKRAEMAQISILSVKAVLLPIMPQIPYLAIFGCVIDRAKYGQM